MYTARHIASKVTRMKIGYLIQQEVELRQPPYNGPANHTRELVRSFQSLGHEVRVLFRAGDQLWMTDDLENFTHLVVPWADRGLLRILERLSRRIQYELKLPYAALFESLRFAGACTQELRGYDLLYERATWVSYGAGLAAKHLDIPLILEDNGDHLADLDAKGIAPRGLQRTLSLLLMKRAVFRAAHVISTGEGWRRAFISRWGYPPDHVTTVENGTHLCELLPHSALKIFTQPPTPTGRIRLIYLGGFYPWHGFDVLIPAFQAALQVNPNLHLTLIGAGSGMADALSKVKEAGLSAAVTFTGHLSPVEYAPILASADIGLSPYCGWPEYSGLKILDYKAAGLACIASGKDGMPPTLTHDQTGLIIHPCNPAALEAAILQLSGNYPLRIQMGQQNRLEAEQIYTWEQTARRIELVLANTVRGYTKTKLPK